MGFWDRIRNSVADNSEYHWGKACEHLDQLNRNDPKAVEHLTTGLDRLRQEGRAVGYNCFCFHTKRAECYVRLGRPAEAVADYREAFRVYPDAAKEPLNLIGRAKALQAAGEYEAALADLDEAVRLKPVADEA
ncbi:MAG: tetratricopeptide repeat protein, partial [Gemmataceae bacterium]|nr:tetratricopeptide repeat protein [Gemmataceae bacterium]